MEATPTPIATTEQATSVPEATMTLTEPAQPRTEEIRFRSGDFELVGDLRFPAGDGPHPAIIMVHGSGSATRNGAVPFRPLIEIFQRHGYAVFSWDTPGKSQSTGQFDEGQRLTQRAEILAKGIEVLVEHPAIDSSRIGLWGISQAGWVMPMALELTDDVAFMIVISGGAEDSIEQMAYQYGQKVVCGGGSLEQAALVEQYGAQAMRTTSYAEYLEAMEILLEIPNINLYTGVTIEIVEEEEWKPWPRDIDSFIDPMEIIEHTTIPVLALFGELDKNIDPVQGAEGYEAALQAAGNQNYHVEVIPAAGHVLMPAKTGCIGEFGGTSYSPRYLELMEEWLIGLGDGSE
jgi:pimeloyl-ACP methyl ester carboxylesterase